MDSKNEFIAATVTGSPEYDEDLVVEEASNHMNDSVIPLEEKEICLQENILDSGMNNIRIIKQICDLTRTVIKLNCIPSECKESSIKIMVKGTKGADVELAYELVNKLLAAFKKPKHVAKALPQNLPSASGIGYLHSEELSSDGCTEVCVSAIENPNKFWVNIIRTKRDQLGNLITEMTKFYNEELQSPENKDSLQLSQICVGDIVSAFDQENREWHRAQVVKVSNDPKQITVLYLDLGKWKTLSPDVVCTFNPKFFPLPFQAIECSLAGVKPKYGEWSKEAINAFEEIVDRNQDVLAEGDATGWRGTFIKAKPIKKLAFKSQNDLQKTVQLVKLLDLNTDVDVGSEMIDRGYGKPVYKRSVLLEGENRRNEWACLPF